MASLLLIEDDDAIRMVVVMLLSRGAEQHEVCAVADPKEGLALLESRTFDLALVDLVMPHMSGIELIRAIRSNPVHERVPIVALTAAVHLKAAAVKAGADALLIKPFDVDELRAIVARTLTHGSGCVDGATAATAVLPCGQSSRKNQAGSLP